MLQIDFPLTLSFGTVTGTPNTIYVESTSSTVLAVGNRTYTGEELLRLGSLDVTNTGGASDTGFRFVTDGTSFVVLEPTPEQREQQRLEFLKAEIRARRAERKARKLFRRVFGEGRFVRVCRDGFMEVLGNSGTRYWIGLRGGMDFLVPNGQRQGLCVFVEGVPQWDRLLALALLVQSGPKGEQELRRRANSRGPSNFGVAA